MAIIGHGYGSEWHLLRWMGRHRKAFDAKILAAIGKNSGVIEWEDAKFRLHRWPDEELEGIEFIQEPGLQTAWREFWPSTGRAQTWDAVGWVRAGDEKELILIEAKAHLGELASNCNAADWGGRGQIQKALAEVKQTLGVAKDCDWCVGYYQYANRLAALHFLDRHNITAHLVFIYFVGDESDSRRNCPRDQSGWTEALRMQKETLGLPTEHGLSSRIIELFLPVAGDSSP